MAFKQASEQVLFARAKRSRRAVSVDARVKDFHVDVAERLVLTLTKRVKLASLFLRDRVVRNISRAVTKGTGPEGGRVVRNRSKPGEFPKADTTQLMKTVFEDFRMKSGNPEGYVGTPLDYGLVLETTMDRSFLVRTLREEGNRISDIITGPIR